MESEDADAQERLGMLSLDSTMSQSQDLHILPLADTTTDSPPETNSATGTLFDTLARLFGFFCASLFPFASFC